MVLAWWLALSLWLEPLALNREYQARSEQFMAALSMHLRLVGAAVGASLLLAALLVMLMRRHAGARKAVFAVLNVVQTIPSLALFGLLLAPLAWLGARVDWLGALGVGGIGWAPAFLALLGYSLLPMVRNLFVALEGVEPAVIESACGMGMSQRQVFWQVRLPLALPVVLEGVRITTVQAIGLTAVAALIGAGARYFHLSGTGAGGHGHGAPRGVADRRAGPAGGRPAGRLDRLPAPRRGWMIELSGVTKRFGDTTAVNAVTLSIKPGQLCVLVGTSGCGKSTTLRMINRLIAHDEGEIRLDGQPVGEFEEALLRRRIGYVIQSTGLFPHWTVARNIGVVPRLLKWQRQRSGSASRN